METVWGGGGLEHTCVEVTTGPRKKYSSCIIGWGWMSREVVDCDRCFSYTRLVLGSAGAGVASGTQ